MNQSTLARSMYSIGLVIGFGVWTVAASAAKPPAYRWTETGTFVIVLGDTWNSSVFSGVPYTYQLDFRSSSSSSPAPGTVEARYDDVSIRGLLKVGNYRFSFESQYPGFPPTIAVVDNWPQLPTLSDGYYWYWQSPDTHYELVQPFWQGHLLSSDLTTLMSPALDVRVLPVSHFDLQNSRQLTASDAQGDFHTLVGSVESYSVVGIPEPISAVLVMVAAHFIGWRRPRPRLYLMTRFRRVAFGQCSAAAGERPRR